MAGTETGRSCAAQLGAARPSINDAMRRTAAGVRQRRLAVTERLPNDNLPEAERMNSIVNLFCACTLQNGGSDAWREGRFHGAGYVHRDGWPRPAPGPFCADSRRSAAGRDRLVASSSPEALLHQLSQ